MGILGIATPFFVGIVAGMRMRYCAKFDHGGFETFLMINGWVMKDIGASRPQAAPLSRFEQLRIGREIVQSEAKALGLLAKGLDDSFLEAVDRIVHVEGCVIVTGMGKAGLIGRKISATFASTGTPSHFLHPAEAIHGDLGVVTQRDLVLILSQSGETSEVTQLLPSLRQQCAGLIAITASPNSSLARAADVAILLPQVPEACFNGLAPSTSTVAMLSMGDAIALLVSQMRGFSRDDFARFHPGGALGKKLSRVEEVMRPLEQCRVASQDQSVREVLVSVAKSGRRIGAIMLLDPSGTLSGIFTDSDLARLMEKRSESQLDCPMREKMTTRFHAIRMGARLEDAIDILANKKFSELPVVDDQDRPMGMIDITDVLGLVQAKRVEAAPQGESAPKTIRLFDPMGGD